MPEIYVLSNELRVQGAAVIFYTDVLKGFAEETGSDLILLPSSVHEWLVLLDSPSYDEENLEAMVREANAQVVMEDEVLSGSYLSLFQRKKRIVPVRYGQNTGQKR